MTEEHHALYSPSKLSRILACPGSVALTDTSKYTLPKEQPSPYAQEGTDKHEMIANMLSKIYIKGYSNTNGIPEDVKECFDYATLHMRDINIIPNYRRAYHVFIEQRVTLSSFGIEEVYGTLDFAYINSTNNEFVLIDWKFGYNRVDAQDNDQLMAYAAGFHLSVFDLSKMDSIKLIIFQPAIDHTSLTEVSVKDIMVWLNKVQTSINLLETDRDESQRYKPSKKTCKWCRVAPICKANHKYVQQIAADTFKAYTAIAETKDNDNDKDIVMPKQLADLLDKSKAFTQHIKVINDYIYNRLIQNESFEGFKLVHGRSNRIWAASELDIIDFIEHNTKVQEAYKTVLKSPAQCEKEDSALKKNTSFGNLYTKKEGKPIIARAEDKRKEYAPTSVFKNCVEK